MLTGAHCAILNPRFQGYRPRWHVLDGIVPYAENDTTTWTGFPQLRRRARFASMAELPVPVERQAFWTGAQACRRSRASGVSEHLPHGHPNNRDWPRSFATSMSVRVGPSKSAPLRDVASGLAGNGHATPGSAPAGHGVDYRARTMPEGASRAASGPGIPAFGSRRPRVNGAAAGRASAPSGTNMSVIGIVCILEWCPARRAECGRRAATSGAHAVRRRHLNCHSTRACRTRPATGRIAADHRANRRRYSPGDTPVTRLNHCRKAPTSVCPTHSQSASILSLVRAGASPLRSAACADTGWRPSDADGHGDARCEAMLDGPDSDKRHGWRNRRWIGAILPSRDSPPEPPVCRMRRRGFVRRRPRRGRPEYERRRADGRAQHADAAPSVRCVDGRRRDRAEPAADRIEQHVGGDEPAVRIRPRAEDHALIRHVNRLSAGIEQHDAEHERP